mmetsp:Transcript_27236/g.87758  ORF Transcript_27236/g.87758 Transcript_27236/m.87758 type:complete len:798 (+) Transcript_27236:139-2532(+)
MALFQRIFTSHAWMAADTQSAARVALHLCGQRGPAHRLAPWLLDARSAAGLVRSSASAVGRGEEDAASGTVAQERVGSSRGRSHAAVIQQLAGSRAWAKALEVLWTLRASHVVLDADCHVAALGAAARGAAPLAALEVLRAMRLEGLPCEVAGWNAAISACGRGHSWQDALGLLFDMQAQHARPDLITCNTLITACGRAGEWQQSLLVLDQAASLGLEPDNVTRGAVMSALERGREWILALQTLEAWRLLHSPNLVVHTAAMAACGRAQAWAAALDVLEKATEQMLHVDAMAHSIAVDACSRASQWAASVAVLRESSALGVQSVDAAAYSAAIMACSCGQEWARGLELLTEASTLSLPTSKAARRLLGETLRATGLAAEASEVARGGETPRSVASSGPGGIHSGRLVGVSKQSDLVRREASVHRRSAERPKRSHTTESQESQQALVAEALVGSIVTVGQEHGTYLLFANGPGAVHTLSAFQNHLGSGGRLLAAAGDSAAEMAMRRAAAGDGRVAEVKTLSLGELAHVVPHNVLLAGVVVDTTGSALPPQTMDWLAEVSGEDLGRALVEQADGAAGDPLLWERVGEAIAAEVRKLQRNLGVEVDDRSRDYRSADVYSSGGRGGGAEVARLVRLAIGNLHDPAGPPPRLVLDAIRAHLGKEDDSLERGLCAILNANLVDDGARLAVVCGRRRASEHLQAYLRTAEDCDPEMVEDWPIEKVFALFPSLSAVPARRWALADVGHSSSPHLLPGVLASGVAAHIFEKRARRDHDWGPAPEGPPAELFREPTTEPLFAGQGTS